MRLRLALPVAVAAAAVGLGLFAPASAPAGCVGPRLRVPGVRTGTPSTDPATGQQLSPVSLRAGQPVTVRGTWFFDGCNDTSGSTGCSSPPKPPPTPPAHNVRLTLVQNGRTWQLGTADAAGRRHQYAVRWDVTLPADLEPGVAVLSARTAEVPVVVPG
jgi:hypothetical protein